jgi:hypothetical protein
MKCNLQSSQRCSSASGGMEGSLRTHQTFEAQLRMPCWIPGQRQPQWQQLQERQVLGTLLKTCRWFLVIMIASGYQCCLSVYITEYILPSSLVTSSLPFSAICVEPISIENCLFLQNICNSVVILFCILSNLNISHTIWRNVYI